MWVVADLETVAGREMARNALTFAVSAHTYYYAVLCENVIHCTVDANKKFRFVFVAWSLHGANVYRKTAFLPPS